MRNRIGVGITSLLAALALAAPASAVTIIETLSSWNGTQTIGNFGETNTATYGQVITAAGPDTVLDAFTFYLDDFEADPDVVDFEAFVWQWDGFKAVGPALYQSAPMSTTNNGGAGGLEPITITTGGVELTAGLQYVLSLSASNLFDGSVGRAVWGTINSGASSPDTYPGGNFVFMNNGANLGQLFTQNWSQRSGDTAFSATFSAPVAVPEPTTASLLGLGLLGLAGGRRPRG